MSNLPERTQRDESAVNWFAPLSKQDQLGTNLSDQVRMQWIENLLPAHRDQSLAKGAGEIEQRLKEMERELLGKDPTPLDQMLVRHVVTCWFRVQGLEIRNAWQQDNGQSTRMLEYYDRALDRAHNRLSRAVRDLAFVRRQPIQINIGKNLFAVQGSAQVNK